MIYVVYGIAFVVALLFVKRRGKLSQRKLLTVGSLAPDFTLPDADGIERSLSDYRGRYVVLAFYPADSTPGCSLEMKRIGDSMAEFDALNAVPIGISKQDVESKCEFRKHVGIPFLLLADTESTAIFAYGVASPGRTKADRVTYIIDPNGVVAYVDPDVDLNLLNVPGAWLRRLREISAATTS